MLTVNASTPRAASRNESASAPAPGAADANPAGFASLLRQTRAPQAVAMHAPEAEPVSVPAATPAAPTDAASSDPPSDDAPNAADAAPEHAMRDRSRALPKGKPRATDGATPRGLNLAPTGADMPEDPATNMNGNAATAIPTGGDRPIDPSVLHWLANAQHGDTAARTEPATATRTALTNDSATTIEAGTSPTSDAAPAARADEPRDKGRPEPTGGRTRFAEVRAERGGSESAPARAVAEATERADTATPAPNTTTFAPLPVRSDAAAPAALTIAAPVHAPEFASTLGLQISVLARDGVQQAELHLNPAEMGPVSVQIVMDGTQARVEFGADVAATRQAIEAGLPALASALQDAGFTLAGGGVSQHGAGRQGGDHESHTRRGARAPAQLESIATAALAAQARRASVSLGGVDLYA